MSEQPAVHDSDVFGPLPVWDTSPQEQLAYFLQQAKIPELTGVGKRVVDALHKRVGHSSMDIQAIANDLYLSKRTLQRRLQEQGYSYTELRDRVRKHYAINAVLEGRSRVDDIYTALDFADRSSLTLAFKRWTGFAPRSFGKLFRDYY